MSTKMSPSDPAFWMLESPQHVSTPVVNDPTCYICKDPEFAQMGLPLCQPCPNCTDSPGDGVGHVPADDIACSVCGFDLEDAYQTAQEASP